MRLSASDCGHPETAIGGLRFRKQDPRSHTRLSPEQLSSPDIYFDDANVGVRLDMDSNTEESKRSRLAE